MARAARPPAMNMATIHGEQIEANCASRSKPQTAKVTTTAPTQRTRMTKETCVGYQRVSAAMPRGMRTAEAETVIMAPARIQWSTPLRML